MIAAVLETVGVVTAPRLGAASGDISTVAGTTSGFAGDGGQAIAAKLSSPEAVVADSAGNLFIADNGNARVRRVDATSGVISTVAGTGVAGYSGDGGAATSAQIRPMGIAVDSAGNLYIADGTNHRIRKVSTAGVISTIAGTGVAGFTGDGGAGSSAQLSEPTGNPAVDAHGNVYFTDTNNHRVRKIDPSGIITTVAGTVSGSSGDGGAAVSAKLKNPMGVAVDSLGQLYVADTVNYRVRRIDSNGIITTLAGSSTTSGYSGDGGPGTSAKLGSSVKNVAVDHGGNVFIPDQLNNRVRRVDGGTNVITTIVGPTYALSGDGGPSDLAGIRSPRGVAVSGSSVLVADTLNHRIRRIEGGAAESGLVAPPPLGDGRIETIAGYTSGFAGDNGQPTSAKLSSPEAVAVDHAGNVFILDRSNARIRRIDKTSGLINTVAGTGTAGFSGDGGAATGAQIRATGIAVDAAGNLYIADGTNHRIRKVNTSGVISTVAGTGVSGYTGDGGPSTSAKVNNPQGNPAVDASGNVFFTDTDNHRVRKIDSTGTITTVAGTHSSLASGFSGDGGLALSAQMNFPTGIAAAIDGSVYFADTGNRRIRRITSDGYITTVAGNGSAGYAGDDGPATSAQINALVRNPGVDEAGNLYIPDQTNARVRRVDAVTHVIATIAGTGTSGFSGDGGAAISAQLGTVAGVASFGKALYIADLGNHRIRRAPDLCPTTGLAACRALSPSATPGRIRTIAGKGPTYVEGTQATSVAVDPSHVTADAAGNIYFSQPGSIRRIDAATGLITTVAGTGTTGYSGDGGPATSAQIGTPAIEVDAAGNLFLVEASYHRVRKIDTSGVITKIAGTGTSGFSGDGGAATSAQLNEPTGKPAIDAAGNVYVADQWNHRLRRISATGVITTIAGPTGTPPLPFGFSGDGGPATSAELRQPSGVALGGDGTIYFLDAGNYRVRAISPAGVINTVAGNGSYGFSGDGGAATSAMLYTTTGSVDVDRDGNIYIPDTNNYRIRRVDSRTGRITTVAGNGISGFGGDGSRADTARIGQVRTIEIHGENLFIADGSNGRVRAVAGITSSEPPATAYGHDPYGDAWDGLYAAVGNYVWSATDLEIDTVGPALELTRTYNSLNSTAGMFGTGWTSTYELSASEDPITGDVTVAFGDGHSETYRAQPGGSFTPPTGYASRLATAGGGWELTLKDRTTYDFDPTGRLLEVSDRYGRSLQLTYSGTQLTAVLDPISNRSLTFAYTGGRVTFVSTSAVTGTGYSGSLTWNYAYSGTHLLRACDPRDNDPVTGMCSVYEYTADRLTRAKDPAGHTDTLVAYRSDGRVDWREDGLGNRTSTAYPGNGVVNVTDPRGNTTVVEYDGNFRTAATTDPEAGTTRYVYDANGFRSGIADANGHLRSFVYDQRGNVIAETDAAGATTYSTYDTADNRTETRGARSTSATDDTYLTVATYDTSGSQLTETSPATTEFPTGVTRSWTYTTGTEPAIGGGVMPVGLLRTETDARDATTTHSYDAAGNLREAIDRVGLETTHTYDELGRRLTTTTYTAAYPAGTTTTYTYDQLGHTLSVTEPATTNRVTSTPRQLRLRNTYDAAGNLTAETRDDIAAADPATTARTSTYTYDDADRPTTKTDAEDGTTSRSYDAAGNVVSVSDQLGRVTTSVYDKANRPTSLVAEDVIDDPIAGSTPRDVTLWERSYDSAGRLISESDAEGRVRRFAYDCADRLVRETLTNFVDRTATTRPVVLRENTYDQAGNLIAEVAGGGLRRIAHSFDALDRQVTTTVDPDGLDRTTTRTFDENGNLTQETVADATSSSEVRVDYDAADRLTHRTLENGINDLVTVTSYDERGQVTATIDPRGQQFGADPAQYTTSYLIDELGRPYRSTGGTIEAVEGGGTPLVTNPTTTIGYDTFGNATHQQDPRGHTTVTGYDKLNRQTTITHPAYTPPGAATLTPVETFVYDPVGNVTARTDRNGNTTDFTFDSRNRVVEKLDPAIGTEPRGVTRFEWDDAGNRIAQIDQRDVRTEATYDARNRTRTRSIITASGTLTTTYDYDDADDLTYLADPTGAVTTHTYSAAGERLTTTAPGGATTTFTYDHAFRLTRTTDPIGRATTNAFDGAGRLTATSRLDTTGTPVATETYSYDAAGNQITTTSPRGNQSGATAADFTTTRAFDAGNRLTAVTEATSATSTITTTYGYDAAGNLTRLTDGRGNRTTYAYTPWNQLEATIEPATTAHPASADRTWTTSYDNAGLPVAETEPGSVTVARAFDELGRLTDETATDGTTPVSRSFTYDPAGLRLTATTATGTLSFTYDERRLLTATTGIAGASTLTYDSAARLTAQADAAGTTTYTWTDRGQLATITDPLTNTTIEQTWDLADQLTSTRYGTTTGAPTRAYTYDTLGRLTTDTLANAGGTTAQLTYTYDADNNLTSQTATLPGNAAAGTHGYSYDNAGRLAGWTPPAASTVTFSYDDAGNRTGAGPDTYTYDERNRLTSGAGTTYTWTPTGQLQSQVSLSGAVNYTYDALGRLTASGPLLATTYTHDAVDRVVTRDSDTFTYAGTNIDPTTIGDSTMARTPTGDPVSIDTGATATLFARNRHGDIAYTINPDGTAANTRIYEPHGKLAGTTGTLAIPIGYQADYTDPATGQVWMGARWYDPAGATFTTRDTVFGQLATPVTLNRYTYAGGDPLQYFDPDGRSFLGDAWDATGGKAVTAVNDHVVKPLVDNVIKPAANAVRTVVDKAASAASTGYRKAESATRTVRKHAASAASSIRRSVADICGPRGGRCIAVAAIVAVGVICQACATGALIGGGIGSGIGTLTCKGNWDCVADTAIASAVGGSLTPIVPAAGVARVFGSSVVGLGTEGTSQFFTNRFDAPSLGLATLFGGLFGKFLPGDPSLSSNAGRRLAPRSVADDLVPDDFMVVRGGMSDVPPPGEVFSGAAGRTLDDAAAGVPHGQIRATTAGDIRAGGGSVLHAPELTRSGVLNERHVNICLGTGPCPFGPLQPNPVPKSGRIQ